jgi:hypothetical protein
VSLRRAGAMTQHCRACAHHCAKWHSRRVSLCVCVCACDSPVRGSVPAPSSAHTGAHVPPLHKWPAPPRHFVSTFMCAAAPIPLPVLALACLPPSFPASFRQVSLPYVGTCDAISCLLSLCLCTAVAAAQAGAHCHSLHSLRCASMPAAAGGSSSGDVECCTSTPSRQQQQQARQA